jgi:Cys-tRNA(Pro)/Cys-tRNA(Cys) deacylase
MKKLFTTVINSTAKDFDTIIFSAGKVGYQVQVAPDDLKTIVPFTYFDVIN